MASHLRPVASVMRRSKLFMLVIRRPRVEADLDKIVGNVYGSADVSGPKAGKTSKATSATSNGRAQGDQALAGAVAAPEPGWQEMLLEKLKASLLPPMLQMALRALAVSIEVVVIDAGVGVAVPAVGQVSVSLQELAFALHRRTTTLIDTSEPQPARNAAPKKSPSFEVCIATQALRIWQHHQHAAIPNSAAQPLSRAATHLAIPAEPTYSFSALNLGRPLPPGVRAAGLGRRELVGPGGDAVFDAGGGQRGGGAGLAARSLSLDSARVSGGGGVERGRASFVGGGGASLDEEMILDLRVEPSVVSCILDLRLTASVAVEARVHRAYVDVGHVGVQLDDVLLFRVLEMQSLLEALAPSPLPAQTSAVTAALPNPPHVQPPEVEGESAKQAMGTEAGALPTGEVHKAFVALPTQSFFVMRGVSVRVHVGSTGDSGGARGDAPSGLDAGSKRDQMRFTVSPLRLQVAKTMRDGNTHHTQTPLQSHFHHHPMSSPNLDGSADSRRPVPGDLGALGVATNADSLVISFGGWGSEAHEHAANPEAPAASVAAGHTVHAGPAGSANSNVHASAWAGPHEANGAVFTVTVCEVQGSRVVNAAKMENGWVSAVVVLPEYVLHPASVFGEQHLSGLSNDGASLSLDMGLGTVSCQVEPFGGSSALSLLENLDEMRQVFPKD